MRSKQLNGHGPLCRHRGSDLCPTCGERFVPAASFEKAVDLLTECLGDYSHPNFSDRYGMAPRIKRFLEESSGDSNAG